jgi:hypothetical protein
MLYQTGTLLSPLIVGSADPGDPFSRIDFSLEREVCPLKLHQSGQGGYRALYAKWLAFLRAKAHTI